MSYIFSQELVAEYSADNYSDTDAFVPLNGSHTPRLCFLSDKPTEHSRLSLFGLTCKTLTVLKKQSLADVLRHHILVQRNGANTPCPVNHLNVVPVHPRSLVGLQR